MSMRYKGGKLSATAATSTTSAATGVWTLRQQMQAQAASAWPVPQLIGQTEYTTSGTYSWVCPAGVSSVSVVAIGGGAAGDPSYAGAGGGLGYKNNYSVTAGSSYTVVVGAGNTSTTGGQSYFVSTGVVRGGPGATYNGGSYTGDGGGYGGQGGTGGSLAGGGGAGGYAGYGGDGANASGSINGNAGSGGGGGGGGRGRGVDYVCCSYFVGGGGGGGGGTGIYGQGSNGSAGTGATYGTPATGGGGGSSGSSGGSGSANPCSGYYYAGDGGTYGGGGGSSASGRAMGSAQGGAVRIIYPGTTRSFPSTNTGNL